MMDLIIKSAVNDQFENHSVAADFYDALDEEVADVLDDATRRAAANDRTTVQPRAL